jgi:nucleotide-binding universal stress UspA family protein
MGTKGARGLREIFSGSETQIIGRRSRIPLLSLMCDRSDLRLQNLLFVHDFSHPGKEDLQLLHKFINAFDTKLHFLQIVEGNPTVEKAAVELNMKKFAELNQLTHFECHLVNDRDVEQGVIHFNQVSDMDLICIGTHGKGGLFHKSATEKLINHLFKPIISFHLNNS